MVVVVSQKKMGEEGAAEADDFSGGKIIIIPGYAWNSISKYCRVHGKGEIGENLKSKWNSPPKIRDPLFLIAVVSLRFTTLISAL